MTQIAGTQIAGQQIAGKQINGKTVLILDSNDPGGDRAAAAFWNAGWRVTVFDRARDNLESLTRGQSVIVAGAKADPSPLHKRILDAARVAGATVILPDSVALRDLGVMQ